MNDALLIPIVTIAMTALIGGIMALAFFYGRGVVKKNFRNSNDIRASNLEAAITPYNAQNSECLYGVLSETGGIFIRDFNDQNIGFFDTKSFKTIEGDYTIVRKKMGALSMNSFSYSKGTDLLSPTIQLNPKIFYWEFQLEHRINFDVEYGDNQRLSCENISQLRSFKNTLTPFAPTMVIKQNNNIIGHILNTNFLGFGRIIIPPDTIPLFAKMAILATITYTAYTTKQHSC